MPQQYLHKLNVKHFLRIVVSIKLVMDALTCKLIAVHMHKHHADGVKLMVGVFGMEVVVRKLYVLTSLQIVHRW